MKSIGTTFLTLFILFFFIFIFPSGLDAYRYSKTVAEKRFWKLLQNIKTNPRRVQGAAILPSFIVGPPRTSRTDGESTTFMRMALSGILPYRGDTPMCDVRDVALAHMKAAKEERAKGSYQKNGTKDEVEKHRFIVSSERAVQIPVVLEWLRDEYGEKYEIVARKGSVIQSSSASEKESEKIFCSKNNDLIGMKKLRLVKESILDMAKAMLMLKSVIPLAKTSLEFTSAQRVEL